MVRATKSPLLLGVAAWAGAGLLLGLSIPSTAYTTGSMNTTSSILDTRTTSARYTSNSMLTSSATSANTTSSIVDTKTTSARYTSEFIPEEEETSSSGLTSSEGLCVANNPGCLSDADCSTCLTLSSREGNSGTPCQSRYPDHFNSSSTLCEQVAAIYCCYYEDELTAEGCLGNFHTAQYWNCIVTGLGLDCVVEDMPCYRGVLTETSSPTAVPTDSGSETASPSAFAYTEVPTSSPTTSPDGDGSDLTAAPTQAPSPPPSDRPTTSPTVGEPRDITGDLNGASGLAAGALVPWRLVLFAWGLGIWLSTTLVHARC